MRKHILSKFAEKRMVGKVQKRFLDGTYHTDSLENSDIDSFNRREQPICDGTTITGTIEPTDVEMLNAGDGWTKATETIESSDIDPFSVNRIRESSKATYCIEPVDFFSK